MGKTVFDLYNGKMFVFCFFSFLHKKFKEYITPCHRIKNDIKVFVDALSLQSKKFPRLCNKLKKAADKKFWNWGPTTIWHKISPP